MNHQKSDVSEPVEIQQITVAYQAGKIAFERGRYREAVQNLVKASALATPNSRLRGEIQICLVTAYEAAGQPQSAIALCRQLARHPDPETRKQSRRLLCILEAPQLNLRPEWFSQIPDFSSVTDSDLREFRGHAASTTRPARQAAPPKPVDLNQVNTQDNQFLWLALFTLVLIIGGLFWFS